MQLSCHLFEGRRIDTSMPLDEPASQAVLRVQQRHPSYTHYFDSAAGISAIVAQHVALIEMNCSFPCGNPDSKYV